MNSAKALVRDAAFTGQMYRLQAFCTAPFWMGRAFNALSLSSWVTMRAQVMGYLGYAHQCCGVSRPGLSHFADPVLMGCYVQARIQKGCAKSTVTGQLGAFKRVLDFLGTQPWGIDQAVMFP